MAEVTHGPAYLFGVNATIASARVISDSLAKAHQIQATVTDEQGRVVHERDDDLLETRNVVLRIQSGYTVATPSATLSYRGATWKIVSVDDAQTNADFEQVSLTVQKRQYLTYS